MHTPRALVVALVILGTPAFSQGGPGGAVDPRMVGTWDLKVQNLDVWVLKIESAGSYVFTIEGPVAQPGHSGVFQTGSGRWSLRSTAGTPWTDGGAYTFADQDTVSMAGNLGVAVWKRRKGTDQKSVDASGGAVVSAGRSLTKVLPLVGAAHAQARAWQQDAALIAIYVKTGADGKVSLSNLAGPANFNGDFVSMQFHSVQAGLVHAYGVDPTGRVAPQSMPMPPGTETARIPELFLDLDAAFVKARELGLKVPPAGGKSFMDARLVGVRGEAGRANAATWTITAVDMSGAFPVPMGEPTVLNAASGEQTTEEALWGGSSGGCWPRSSRAARRSRMGSTTTPSSARSRTRGRSGGVLTSSSGARRSRVLSPAVGSSWTASFLITLLRAPNRLGAPRP